MIHDELDRLFDRAWTTLGAAPAIGRLDKAVSLGPLVRWLELVATWNRKIDLTAAKTDADLVELGVLDALQIAAHLEPRGASVVDVGSGFGAPGLPLALLRGDLRLTLVEPLGKRATFLRTCVGALGMTSRIEVRETRGEACLPSATTTNRPFDAAISRATLSPESWLALGDELAPSGPVVLLLAREPVPAHATRHVAWTQTYATNAGAGRTAVALDR